MEATKPTNLNEEVQDAKVNETEEMQAEVPAQETEAQPTEETVTPQPADEPTAQEETAEHAEPEPQALEEHIEAEEAEAEPTLEAPQPEAVAEQSVEEEPEAELKEEKQLEAAAESVEEPTTKEEVIARLTQIADTSEQVERQQLEQLKLIYYRLHNAELAAAREAFIAEGGDPEAFQPATDATEEEFKAAMNRVKELRAKVAEEAEQARKANLERKEAIIKRVEEMTADADVADRCYKEFKELQAEWNTLGEVPAEKATTTQEAFRIIVEKFYDLLRINHAMREYDFKKNLEIKTAICEAAERLAEVADPITAFRQLQQLHIQFREAGPVAKDLREEVWNRFKAASTVVNKRHQEHFEKLKAQEEENLAKKTALCEKAEAIELDKLGTMGEWDKATKVIIDLQAEWKTIGFTSRKNNTKIFERFRTACDKFFQAKAEYFKTLRAEWAANLEAKTRLCEEAEALSTSTDWNATTSKLVELQKQWKTIGPTARKVSESIWKRFNTACNAFFNAKNEAIGSKREEENANYRKKLELVERLEQLLTTGAENAQEAVREIISQWNETGFVPFRKKDALGKRYRDALDRLRTEFHISAGRRSVESFKGRIADKGGSQLERELARLRTKLEADKQEISNYETNLSFFSSKSKSGNALVDEIQRKINRLKEDLLVTKEKIAATIEQIKNGDKPAPEPAPVAAESETSTETVEEAHAEATTTEAVAPVLGQEAEKAEPEAEEATPEAEAPTAE